MYNIFNIYNESQEKLILFYNLLNDIFYYTILKYYIMVGIILWKCEHLTETGNY